MFQNLCKEDRELYLKDGTEKIWEGRRIDEAVRRARKNEEWRSEYMKELLHDDDVREEGRAEGREEGLIEGREEGRVEERLETARRMRSDGLSMEMVVRYTGLSEEEINNL